MRRVLLISLCLLTVLGQGSLAGREEGEDGPADRADLARAAHASGDAAALEALASELGGQLWILADRLRADGNAPVALALARAWSHPERERLATYLEGQQGVEEPDSLRDGLTQVRDRREAGLFQTALDLAGGLYPVDATVLAVMLEWERALALEGAGRPGEAMDAFAEATRSANAIGWVHQAARGAEREGGLAWQDQDTVRARKALAQAYALYRRLGAAYPTLRAQSNLASVFARQGDTASALRQFELAAAKAEVLDERAAGAQILTNLAMVYEQRGEFGPALTAAQGALDLVPDASVYDRAYALMILGNIRSRIGQLEEAGDLQAWARQLFEEELERSAALPRERQAAAHGLASAIGNLGNVMFWKGDVPTYLHLQEEALRIFEGEAHEAVGVARCLINLAEGYRTLGRPKQALLYARSGVVRARSLGDVRLLAYTLTEFGRTLQASGDAEGAQKVFEEALGVARAHEARDLALDTLTALAAMQVERGDLASARDTVVAAMTILPYTSGGLGEIEAASARSVQTDIFASGLVAAEGLGDPELGLRFLEVGRAGALLEALGGRHSLREILVERHLRNGMRDALAQEATASAHYVAAKGRGVIAEIRERQRHLESARKRVEAARDRIRRESSRAAHVVYPEPDELTTVQGRLGAGDVLVYYGLHPVQTVALVVRREGARYVRLGPADPIRAALDRTLTRAAPYVDEDRLPDLRKRLVDPLELDPEVERVLISPDGILAYLPFAALLPGRDVACAPSATTLGLLVGEAGIPAERVLALGDPVYAGAPSGGSAYGPSRAGLSRLKASGDEARAVGDVVLVREQATESRLAGALEQQARWRAVHLACHGIVNTEHPGLSGLLLTPGDGDDGFLSVREVFGLRAPADLVVLSACVSGRGKIFRGEGVMGVARAFMYAGASRVLVSLWMVDDEATRALMEAFYRHWREGGQAPARALRLAQQDVRSVERWAHPMFWAGWTLWGPAD